MISETTRRGNIGEDFAAEYLEKNGYTIVKRNFNTKFGEIDIIAKKDNIIAFVEVKSRADDSLFSPREAVTPSKQRKICKAALLYSMANKFSERPRFDVFEVIYGKYDLEIKSFEHIINAFGTEAMHGYF